MSSSGPEDVLSRLIGLLTDVTPLRESAAFRRLWAGIAIAHVGHHMTTIAIAFQIYVLTDSSFAVGVAGLSAILPLVLGGLYGGALVDTFDRRTVALVTAFGIWVCSLLLVLQAVLDVGSVGLLYLVVAIQSAFTAVNGPARWAIVPRLLPGHLLTASNALTQGSANLAMTLGPLLGGLVLAWQGIVLAYVIDAVLFTAALYALFRLPKMPPNHERRGVPGLSSVVEGITFLRTAPNLRMTFVVDLCAMLVAQPRALFPALALTVYVASPSAFGLLQAAPAIGALLAVLVSGWIWRVHRHGVAVIAATVAYGLSIALAGASAIGWPGLIWLGVAILAFSGAFDMVSATFRATMMQRAAPDHLLGRIQGLFTVVVVGGPRLGEFLAGAAAELLGVGGAMLVGGLLCVAGVGVSAWLGRATFLRYDSRTPTP